MECNILFYSIYEAISIKSPLGRQDEVYMYMQNVDKSIHLCTYLHAGCWTGGIATQFLTATAQKKQGIHFFIDKKFLTAAAQKKQGIHLFIAKWFLTAAAQEKQGIHLFIAKLVLTAAAQEKQGIHLFIC